MRLSSIALGCAFTGTLVLAAPLGDGSAAAAAKTRPAMSVSVPAGGYAYGARVKVTVTLHAAAAHGAVSLYAQPAGAARTLVVSGRVNAKGKLYGTYTLTRATAFTAVFAGDARDTAARASRTVVPAARVANRIAGYYKTTSIGGVRYYVFHGSGTLTLYATVTPNKHGECAEPETQEYNARTGWYADTRYGCDSLDGESHDRAPFRLDQAVGDRYRIRADYRRSAKDTENRNANAPWLYFTVVK